MISNVLAEACDAIEEYLVACPETYAHCIEEVRAVYNAMVTLRRKLDNPFFELHDDTCTDGEETL